MRFRSGPPLDILRISFTGRHFQASWECCQRLLPNYDGRIRLVRDDPSAHVVIPFMESLDRATIQMMPNLQLIQQYGVGLEGVHITAATRQGVAVCNIPAHLTGNAQATAEHAIWLSLSLLRQTKTELVRRFQDRQLGGLPVPQSLFGKRVTIVGYGAVGSTIASYMTTMGAHVTVVRRRWPEPPPTDVTALHIEQAFPQTDLLLLACDLNPETHSLLNDERLSLLPSHALVVNVGRGPLVEYDALRRALDNDRIAGFASDVGVGHATKPSEPWDPNDPLSKSDRALFTPHVGGYTDATYEAMAPYVLSNAQKIIRQESPNFWVNQD